MSLSDHLCDTWRARLQSGQWRLGERLPTERELADTHGVSRTTVRKALAQLKEQGLIEQTVGSGTYVAQVPAGGAASPGPVRHTSPADLMEARLALEPALVDLVIRNASRDDLQRMAHCCEQAEQAQTLEAFEHWDAELHQAIAEAAHNPFVASVFQLMTEVRSQSEWGQLKKRSVTPERRLAYQREHRALVEALSDRDAERARALTLEHLVHVRRNLLGV